MIIIHKFFPISYYCKRLPEFIILPSKFARIQNICYSLDILFKSKVGIKLIFITRDQIGHPQKSKTPGFSLKILIGRHSLGKELPFLKLMREICH